MRIDGPAIGDNQENYAVHGPNRLVNGSFEDTDLPGGVQGGTLSQTGVLGPSLGLRSALLVTDGDHPDEGFYSDAVPVEQGETWSFSVWLQGVQGARRCWSASGSTRIAASRAL
jgi:hypothetical protein